MIYDAVSATIGAQHTPNRNPPSFEQYLRQTYPAELLNRPDELFDACVIASYTANPLAYHYGGKKVTAVAPVLADSSDPDYSDQKLKILSAGCFKPKKEECIDESYVRVCAEQNLLDNALRERDILLGVLFVRASLDVTEIEGNLLEGVKLCKPCRGRTVRYIGSGIVIVTLQGDSLEPIEAMTLGQQIDEQDYKKPHKVLAKGAAVKEFVTRKVFGTEDFRTQISHRPLTPSRRYRRTADA